MPIDSRLGEIARLVERRRRGAYVGYGRIGDYHQGAYECEYVSPYSKSAHNIDAWVMIFLQDWSSHDRLMLPLDPEVVRLGFTPSLPTSRNLLSLLKSHLQLELRDTYATNLFPFIKLGNLSARIPASDLVRAGREFALPQLDAVRPWLAICLGVATFNAMRVAIGLPLSPTLASAIEEPFVVGSTRVVCQAHTGNMGRNWRNKGGIDRVSADWEVLGQRLEGVRRSHETM
jgi:hypothetical protein